MQERARRSLTEIANALKSVPCPERFRETVDFVNQGDKEQRQDGFHGDHPGILMGQDAEVDGFGDDRVAGFEAELSSCPTGR